MKHTPGPWILGDKNDTGADIVIGKTVALFGRRNLWNEKSLISRGEMMANAKLAAAAPELLQALEMCLNAGDRRHKRIAAEFARAIIKKATE